ncbi:hypothetical protein TNCT_375341 [Trichonephila clavata]|uniref:Uncharacterized protein n=1 Tax=Trichonephila clavata TaxID=2740835 RepID=A0A8X6K808_TRICU|nr:hypothetical protein TNCT_375341 [Trichonephila clavata]
MLVRLPRAPVLSGGLRRKTQISPVPSTWPLPPRPHLTSPKVLRSLKRRSKCQFSKGAVCCVVIPVVKNKSDSTSFHSVLVCHRTSSQVKLKIICKEKINNKARPTKGKTVK